ncbi:hypothetical protein [Ostreiculturibacter nitratireducens]|uniref:hypothetical protein n=1 Tax=Ostreiculturibacter nitratireducens TaxID=3075226 RepID=UPI0031B60EE1
MGKFFAVLFACILALTFVGLDYLLARQAKAGVDYGFTEHLNLRSGGLTESVFPPELADMFPPVPEGWTVKTADATDLALVTGRPVSDVPADLQGQMDAQATALKALMPGLEMERRTYQEGDDVILVELILVPAEVMQGPGGDALDAHFDMANQMGEPEYFGMLHGVVVDERPVTPEGDVRSLTARIGRQVHLNVMTNASDRRTFELLAGLDMTGLSRMSAEPVEGLDKGRFHLASDPAAGPAIEEALGLSPVGDATGGPKVGFKRAEAGFGQTCGSRAGGKFCSITGSE